MGCCVVVFVLLCLLCCRRRSSNTDAERISSLEEDIDPPLDTASADDIKTSHSSEVVEGSIH